jgi:sugar (pentulose or hexulose) kinase
VSGGFSRNNLFVNMLANIFSNKIVFTSKIDNASALGAALMVASQSGDNPQIDLGLKKYFPF